MSKIQETIEILKESIHEELDFCNAHDTPYMCAAIATTNGRDQITSRIVELVGKQAISIASAIVQIEDELNPQHTAN